MLCLHISYELAEFDATKQSCLRFEGLRVWGDTVWFVIFQQFRHNRPAPVSDVEANKRLLDQFAFVDVPES